MSAQSAHSRLFSCICLLVLHLGGEVEAADANAEEEALTRQLRQHAIAVETTLYQRLSNNEPIKQWRYTLHQAIKGVDLQIVIMETATAGKLAYVDASALNYGLHPVNCKDLLTDNGDITGTLQAQLKRYGGWDGDPIIGKTLKEYEQITIMLTLEAKLSGQNIKGSFTCREEPPPPVDKDDEQRPAILKPSKGRLTGNLKTASQPPVVPDGRSPVPTEASREELLRLAATIEANAEFCYHSLRALTLARNKAKLISDVLPTIGQPSISRVVPEMTSQADLLDDIDDMGMDSLPGLRKVKQRGQKNRKKAPGKATKTPAADEQLLQIIHERLARMHQLVAAWHKSGDVATAQPAIDDPDFGPWYGNAVLPINGSRQSLKKVSRSGPQEWQAVSQWTCLGPFPRIGANDAACRLPDFIITGTETCQLQSLERDSNQKKRFGWQSAKIKSINKYDLHSGAFGYIMPPRWFSGNPYSSRIIPMLGYREYQGQDGHGGLPKSTCYARCIINSEVAQKVWAGFGINRQGHLWINGQLLHSVDAPTDGLSHQQISILQIPFQKGENEIVLRVDVDYATPYWWLRLCMSGSPASQAEVTSRKQAKQQLRQPDRSKAVGFRIQGTGLSSQGQPPLAWNIKQRHNILWHKKLPYMGSSTAVVAPDSSALFLTQDPHWLICLDADTGKERWRRAVTRLNLLPSDERDKGMKIVDQWYQAVIKASQLPNGGDTRILPKWLRYSWYWGEDQGVWAPQKIQQTETSDKLQDLITKRNELESAADPQSVQKELSGVIGAIDKIQADSNPLAKALTETNRDVKKYEAEIKAFFENYGGTTDSSGYWGDYAAWMYATPITDGNYVWLKSGMDVAACYDMDGNEQWMVALNGSGKADNMLSSPRLVDDKLIMTIINRDDKGKRAKKHAGGIRLLALDAATGKERWRTEGLQDFNWNCATPAVVHLNDGQEQMTVIVMPEGQIIRADDGKVLVRDIGAQCCFDSPLVVDDIVLFGHGGLAAVQLIMQGRDRVGFKHLWSQRGNSHGALDLGGCIAVDGMVFFTKSTRNRLGQEAGTASMAVRSEMSERWKVLVGHDLHTGVRKLRIPSLRKSGHQYSPATASPSHIYQIDGDHIFQHLAPKAPMDVTVFSRGERPLRLANNAIDRCYGSCFLAGDRLYIRGYQSVTCIAYTNDKGKAYEAKVIARNLLDDIAATPPTNGPIKEIAMHRHSTIARFPYRHPRNIYKASSEIRLISGHAPSRWWFLGPLPSAEADKALLATGGFKGPERTDESTTISTGTVRWGPLYQEFAKAAQFKKWELDPKNFTDIHRHRRVSQVESLFTKAGSTMFVMTELTCESDRIMRFEDGSDHCTAAWLQGQPISPGDRIQFKKGLYRLVLRIDVDTLSDTTIEISPRFWEDDDPQQESKHWFAARERRLPYLKQVIALAPDSREAKRAKQVLAATPKH